VKVLSDAECLSGRMVGKRERIRLRLRNRDEIVGSDGDTILVAVLVLKKQEICDSSYYALEKRAKRNLYFTSECGNKHSIGQELRHHSWVYYKGIMAT